ncbi:UNVERIFIED_ORG: glycosyltransferase involved in cell wall biosynthesis [Arthrobacter globiformis]|nr:glycosyltransferase involved in cell wall biosynthesis [Arthrobacter globiformis]
MTNMAAPYRIPLWQSLQKTAHLHVALLESSSSLASDVEANRGQDWIPSIGNKIDFLEVPTRKVRRGEARYYFLTKFRSILLPRNYDVVVFGGWESPAYWVLLATTKMHNRGCVAFYESTVATMSHHRGPISWMRKRFFASMDSIVVPGPAAREALISIGVPPEKILEGFNAVDVKAFQVLPQPSDKPKNQGHSYLYVGQLIARKRVEQIVAAFSSVATPNDTLTIVGSGELEAELRSITKGNKSISFMPYVDNRSMPEVMARHNTLVLASSQEVWGLVINEALAGGLHVVVSQNCGVVDSVEHMSGVFVVEPGLSDLAAKMAESRRSWTGPIWNPEILRHTPEEFASVFMAAINQSFRSGSRRSK